MRDAKLCCAICEVIMLMLLLRYSGFVRSESSSGVHPPFPLRRYIQTLDFATIHTYPSSFAVPNTTVGWINDQFIGACRRRVCHLRCLHSIPVTLHLSTRKSAERCGHVPQETGRPSPGPLASRCCSRSLARNAVTSSRAMPCSKGDEMPYVFNTSPNYSRVHVEFVRVRRERPELRIGASHFHAG